MLNSDSKSCFHCGLDCYTEAFSIDEKYFCCAGCKQVYTILNERGLCQYYALNQQPGKTVQIFNGIDGARQGDKRFEYLDDPSILDALLTYRDDQRCRVVLTIPAIHCSSCIWLLENLTSLNEHILSSRVDFLARKIDLIFKTEYSLRSLVELLVSIGYEPRITTPQREDTPARQSESRRIYRQLGVAGFCFGNIMLLSFPEYLTAEGELESIWRIFFASLNLLLSVPVLLYSARDFLSSAWQALKVRAITIDVPLAIGIVAIYSRSVFEILSGSGAGYMDSFAGLIFLLLIGRLFQRKTFEQLSFDRDFRSFFPISVIRQAANGEESVPIDQIQIGDRLSIRNSEIVPVDAILATGHARIDYSFVTGESEPVSRQAGDTIYAGGKQIGSMIELVASRPVSQSYLTRLWNEDAMKAREPLRSQTFVNAASKYFTIGTIAIAGVAALFWLTFDPARALNSFTAVLIIACPCALALSAPFTLGNLQRIFGRSGFYLRNNRVIESLAGIDTIVFDKTGTLTSPAASQLTCVPYPGAAALDPDEQVLVRSTVRQSTHPLSKAIYTWLNEAVTEPVEHFEEIPGHGIEAKMHGRVIRIGSASFTGARTTGVQVHSAVFVSIDRQPRVEFRISSSFRPGLDAAIASLNDRYELSMVSGDNNRHQELLSTLFAPENLYFECSPFKKEQYISRLQEQNRQVLMIGDGLNDGAALKRSDTGIAVSEDIAHFSPACDAILQGNRLELLPRYLRLAKAGMGVIYFNFAISLIYNIAGLAFAVTGQLSPLVSAVLMPLSSITVIATASGATYLLAARANMLAGSPAVTEIETSGESRQSLELRPDQPQAVLP